VPWIACRNERRPECGSGPCEICVRVEAEFRWISSFLRIFLVWRNMNGNH
jgi:hypothetical protein